MAYEVVCIDYSYVNSLQKRLYIYNAEIYSRGNPSFRRRFETIKNVLHLTDCSFANLKDSDLSQEYSNISQQNIMYKSYILEHLY